MNYTASALTNKQSAILAYIRERLFAGDAPPTRADIASHFGFRSPNAAECHLRAIAKKGFIKLIPGTKRGIKVVRHA